MSSVHKPAVHSMQIQEVLNEEHSMVHIFNHKHPFVVARYKVDSEHYRA